MYCLWLLHLAYNICILHIADFVMRTASWKRCRSLSSNKTRPSISYYNQYHGKVYCRSRNKQPSTRIRRLWYKIASRSLHLYLYLTTMLVSKATIWDLASKKNILSVVTIYCGGSETDITKFFVSSLTAILNFVALFPIRTSTSFTKRERKMSKRWRQVPVKNLRISQLAHPYNQL